MGHHHNHSLQLLGSLYEASACPDRWCDFLAQVCRLVKCEKAAVILHDDNNTRPSLQFHYGMPPEAISEYNSYYGVRNPAALPILRQAQRNGWWAGLARDVVGEREYEASEYYHGWGLKYDVYWVVIGAMAHAGSGGATSISLMRPRKARPLSQTTVRFVRQILPHLRRAVQIHSTMESLRATVGSAIEAMHHLEAAMVAINGAGRAVLVSRAAEQIFRQQNGLQLCNGQLACSAPEQDRQLRDLLQGSCGTGAGRGTHTGGMMLVGRDEHSPLHVSVVPFRSSSMLTEVAPCALVFIRSTDRAPASRAHVLSALYGLTPAECRLSDLLLQRPDLKTAGEQLHVTRETARFMLKAILRKTGTHRQAELVRFLLALPGAPL